MRTVSSCLGTVLIVGLIGCNTRSEPGGGAAASNTFRLSAPASATSIKRGETQTVALKVERDKDFKQTVTLKAEAPTGVDVEVSPTSSKASEATPVNLKVTATDKATVGEHVIHVTGTPETGTATKIDVKIKVLDRAEAVNKETTKLTLHGPLLSTTVKQGETKTINISMKQSGTKYAGDVKLKNDNPPKGITTEFTSPAIKGTESGEVGLKITVDKTADLGEQTLRISGTPDSGTVAPEPIDVKLKVVAP